MLRKRKSAKAADIRHRKAQALCIWIFAFATSPACARDLKQDAPRDLFHLTPRSSNRTNVPDLVDPVTMPACTHNLCWRQYSPPPELCPLVDGPCLNDQNASDNGGDFCGLKQYRRDCYCSLKTGLSCAWDCPWADWWATEDWFADLCGGAKAASRLDFSGVPPCARDCIDDSLFGYGCLTQSSNCFCAHGGLFGCQEHCKGADAQAELAHWLEETCDLSPAAAEQAVLNGTFGLQVVSRLGVSTTNDTKGVDTEKLLPPTGLPSRPLSWDEWFIIIVLIVSGLTGIGLWAYSYRPKRY